MTWDGDATTQKPAPQQEEKSRVKSPPPASLTDRWSLIRRHCRMALESGRYGGELHTFQSMRTRLMAYTKGVVGGKYLRAHFCKVASMMELEQIAANHLAFAARHAEEAEEAAVAAVAALALA